MSGTPFTFSLSLEQHLLHDPSELTATPRTGITFTKLLKNALKGPLHEQRVITRYTIEIVISCFNNVFCIHRCLWTQRNALNAHQAANVTEALSFSFYSYGKTVSFNLQLFVLVKTCIISNNMLMKTCKKCCI